MPIQDTFVNGKLILIKLTNNEEIKIDFSQSMIIKNRTIVFNKVTKILSFLDGTVVKIDTINIVGIILKSLAIFYTEEYLERLLVKNEVCPFQTLYKQIAM